MKRFNLFSLIDWSKTNVVKGTRTHVASGTRNHVGLSAQLGGVKTLLLALTLLCGVNEMWGNKTTYSDNNLNSIQSNKYVATISHGTITISGDNAIKYDENAVSGLIFNTPKLNLGSASNTTKNFTLSWSANSGCTINVTKVTLNVAMYATDYVVPFVGKYHCYFSLNGGSEQKIDHAATGWTEVSTNVSSGKSSINFYIRRDNKSDYPLCIQSITIEYTIIPDAPTIKSTTASVSVSLTDENKLDLFANTIAVADSSDFTLTMSELTFASTGVGGSKDDAHFDGRYFYATAAGQYTYSNPCINAKPNCHEKSGNTTGSVTITVNRLDPVVEMNNAEVTVSTDAAKHTLDLNTLKKSTNKTNGDYTYELLGTDAEKRGASISGSTFQSTVGGTFKVRATTSQTGQYKSTTCDFQVTVNRLTPTVTWTPDEDTFVAEEQVAVTSAPGVELNLSVEGDGAEYVTIDNENKIFIIEDYSGATPITATLKVTSNQTDVYKAISGLSKAITISNLTKQYIIWDQDQALTKLKITDNPRSIVLTATSDNDGPVSRYVLEGETAGFSLSQNGNTWTLNYPNTASKGAFVRAELDGVEDQYLPAAPISLPIKVIDPTSACDITENLATVSGLKNDKKEYALAIPKSVYLHVRRTNREWYARYTNGIEIEFQNAQGTRVGNVVTKSQDDIDDDCDITIDDLDRSITKMIFKSNAGYGYDVTVANYAHHSEIGKNKDKLAFETYVGTPVDNQQVTINYANHQIEVSIEDGKIDEVANASSHFSIISGSSFGDCGVSSSNTVTIGYTVPSYPCTETATLCVRDNTGALLISLPLSAKVLGGLEQHISFVNLPQTFSTTDKIILQATSDREFEHQFTYSVVSGYTDVAKVEGDKLTFLKDGDFKLRVYEPGTKLYTEAEAFTEVLHVSKVTPTIATNPTATITYGQKLNTVGLSGGVATVNPFRGQATDHQVTGSFAWTNGSYTVVETGGTTHEYDVTFTPTGDEAGMYNTTTGKATVTVNKITPTLTATNEDNLEVYVNDTQTPKLNLVDYITSYSAESDAHGNKQDRSAITYSCAQTGAVIEGNKFHATAPGTYTITATAPPTDYYNSQTTTFTIKAIKYYYSQAKSIVATNTTTGKDGGWASVWQGSTDSASIGDDSWRHEDKTSNYKRLTETTHPYYFRAKVGTGYTFAGWFTSEEETVPESTQTTYDGSFTISSVDKTNPTWITRYAKFTANTYTVTYVGNGHTGGSTANSNHTYDVEKALTANGFTRAYTVTYNYDGATGGNSEASATAAYTFDHWTYNETNYSNQQSVTNLTSTNGATVTMTAQWEVGTVTLPNPTKTGYKLDGWYNNSTKVGDGGGSYVPTANTTLTAHWTANTYTVKLYPNGGAFPGEEGGQLLIDAIYDAPMPSGHPAPTRSGLDFIGFYDENGVQYYDEDMKSTHFWDKTEPNDGSNITLWAKWSMFQVNYNLNYEGADKTNLFTGWSEPKTYYGVTLTYDPATSYITLNGTCTQNTPFIIQELPHIKAGDIISFKSTDFNWGNSEQNGWPAFETCDFTGAQASPRQAINIDGNRDSKGVTIKEAYQNMAVWVYVYKDRAETNKFDNMKFKLCVEEGSDFASITSPSGKYVKRGEQYGTLAAPERAGYTFLGWFTEQEGGTKIESTTFFEGTDDQVLYAHWEIAHYAINYQETYGLTNPNPDTYTMFDEQDITFEPLKGTRPGYTFAGWDIESIPAGSTGDKEVTALWTALTYTVTLNPNGGTGGDDPFTVTSGAMMPTITTVPQKTGYIFAGYYDAVSGGKMYINADKTGACTWDKSTDATLYAHWTPITYTVHFDANSGEGTMSDQTFTYDVQQALTPNAFTFMGSSFQMWNTQADGKGTAYTNKQLVSNLTTTDKAVVTLYAQWGETIIWQIEDNTEYPIKDKIPFDVATSAAGNIWYTIESPSVDGLITIDNVNKTITTNDTKTGTLILRAHVIKEGEEIVSDKPIAIVLRTQEIVFEQGLSFIADNETGINRTVTLTAYVQDAITQQRLGNPITYTVPSGQTIAEILQPGDKLHVYGIGSTTVTASVPATSVYAAATRERTVHVSPVGGKCNSWVLEKQTGEKDFNRGDVITYNFPKPSACDEIKFDIRHNWQLASTRECVVTLVAADGSGDIIVYNGTPGSSYETKTYSLAADNDHLYSKLTFKTEANITYHVKNVSVSQRSYLRPTDILYDQSTDTYPIEGVVDIGKTYEKQFTIAYSDEANIQYEITNNSGENAFTLVPNQEIDNDCGDVGTYTFTLKTTKVWNTEKEFNETITIHASAGDRIEIPVHLKVSLGQLYQFASIEEPTSPLYWSDVNHWWLRDGSHPTSLPTLINPVQILTSVVVDVDAEAYEIYGAKENPKVETRITIAPQGGLTIANGGITGFNYNYDYKYSKLVIESSREHQGYFRVSPDQAMSTPLPIGTVQLATKSTLDNGANKDATWQYIGIPVVEHNWFDGTDKETCPFNVDYVTWLYEWSEPQGWLYGWNNMKEPVSLKPFQGYAITQYGQPTYEFTGRFLNQNIEIPLTYTPEGMQGQNLIANSYVSPIDAKRFTAEDFVGTAEMDYTFYIFNSGSWNQWNAQSEAGQSLSNNVPGTYTAIPLFSANLLGSETQTLIAPMQGIYIQTYGTGNKIKLDYRKHVWYASASRSGEMSNPLRAPMRATEDGNVGSEAITVMNADVARDLAIRDSLAEVDRQAVASLRHRVRLNVYGENSGADHLYLLEKDAFTPNYDNGYDAPKMWAENGSAEIYTTEQDGQAYMSVSATNQLEGMYVGFGSSDASYYKLSVSSVIGNSLYLKDLTNDVEIPLAEGQIYHFNQAPGTYEDFRFMVVRHEEHDTPTGDDQVLDNMYIWTDEHNLHIENASASSIANLYAVDGRLLFGEKIAHSAVINIDHLPNSVYLVNVDGKQMKFVKK